MSAIRTLALTCAIACVACGRFDFASRATSGDGGATDAGDSLDAHVHVAPGYAIAQLVDLSGVVPYNPNDFSDGSGTVELDNAPFYTAALYPPFTSSLAVVAGRAIIEIAADNTTTVHDYRPATPDTTGPDAPDQITFGDLGGSNVGLWMSVDSVGLGDGLFRIASDWTIVLDTDFNNTLALAIDLDGTYSDFGSIALYEANDEIYFDRWEGPGSDGQLAQLPGPADAFAVIGDAMYAILENADDSMNSLDVIGPAPSHTVTTLATSTSLTLAEGSTANGLFGIDNNAELVAMSPTDGTFTELAWSDDPTWVWKSVCAPRAGHALAGKLVVLESNRVLDRDRLLLVTPP